MGQLVHDSFNNMSCKTGTKGEERKTMCFMLCTCPFFSFLWSILFKERCLVVTCVMPHNTLWGSCFCIESVYQVLFLGASICLI